MHSVVYYLSAFCATHSLTTIMVEFIHICAHTKNGNEKWHMACFNSLLMRATHYSLIRGVDPHWSDGTVPITPYSSSCHFLILACKLKFRIINVSTRILAHSLHPSDHIHVCYPQHWQDCFTLFCQSAKSNGRRFPTRPWKWERPGYIKKAFPIREPPWICLKPLKSGEIALSTLDSLKTI